MPLLSLTMLRVELITGRHKQPYGQLPRLKGMRTRSLAIAALSVAVAGCGSGSLQATGGQTASSATTSASASASAPAAGGTPTAAAGSAAPGTGASASAAPGAAGSGCAAGAQPEVPAAGTLTGLEFVSAAQGWAVGQDTILATSDGGAHWAAQLSGKLNLTSVDFVNGQDGWAVGTTSLLATTDGGAHWAALPEPCPLIRSVHFISPTAGFAVAGGQDVTDLGPAMPALGGTVLATADAGRTWHAVAAPANAQTVCFSDPRAGWLGAGGRLYRTADGGAHWTAQPLASGQPAGNGGTAEMSVECADNGSAWALRVGPGAGMSQAPHVGYHGDASGTVPIFAELYFQGQGGKLTVPSPGAEPGPFSAISSSTAAFIDFCPACGYGTAPWDIAANGGATMIKKGNVGGITAPLAASFQSAAAGWVAGSYTVFPASGTGPARTQQRIVATADGGRTWHVQWSGPWTSS